ncbi:MAG: hypothetical protein V4550_18125 [Gemmatimonadota bacterium]
MQIFALLAVLRATPGLGQDPFGGAGIGVTGAVALANPDLYKPGTMDSAGVRMPSARATRRQPRPPLVVDESDALTRAGLAATALLIIGLGVLARLSSDRGAEQLDPPRATLYVVRVVP